MTLTYFSIYIFSQSWEEELEFEDQSTHFLHRQYNPFLFRILVSAKFLRYMVAR